MTLVIGIGNETRGDDAAGLLAARAIAAAAPDGVRVLECDGEPARLIEALASAEAAYVIDCCTGGGAAGSVHRFDARKGRLPAEPGPTSSHGFGLATTIELARTLGGLPPKLFVFAIEGSDFSFGQPASAHVRAAAHEVARTIVQELLENARPRYSMGIPT